MVSRVGESEAQVGSEHIRSRTEASSRILDERPQEEQFPRGLDLSPGNSSSLRPLRHDRFKIRVPLLGRFV